MKNKRKSYYIGTSAAIVITALFLLWYFKLPLSAESVLNGMDSVEKINYGEYIDEKWDNIYNYDIEDTTEINKLLDALSKSEYTRVSHKNIRNEGRYLSFRIIYDGLQHYRVGVNEPGYLVIEDAATYKFTNNQTEIFNELYTLLVLGKEPLYENDKTR
ncbi:hypothetical protein AM500_19330 [Bacillus sp. FJAT-18017]|uniref:hypothetical protein n=1 Tax=Bacillus sp. FJAT-18017 TaxID=1705566 RepID=UPI0006AEE25E|nr:hypothetical protein [Bacillus sp. FJAT-18017]ALC91695.1 hypothetical protein AM500_19330 [Bacillus sp. FJAT-18017]